MTDKKKPRRAVLVEKGGLEVFEVRVVVWIAPDGAQWVSTEVTTPRPNDTEPEPVIVVGAVELGKDALMQNYREAAGV